MAKAERIWELDALRGLCILGVILVHLMFDLRYFLSLPLNLGPVFQAVADYGGVIFVILSGVCVTLGHRSLRRGLIVFGCGMAITLVTFGMWKLNMADESIVIRFGVLHLLGVCMIVYPLFRRMPTAVLAILSAAIVVAGYWLTTQCFRITWLFPLGFLYPGFSSGDYFPLLPHLGWFLIGVVIGRTAYAQRKSLLPRVRSEAAPLRFLRFCGRHSLWIYLGHQPILYGIVTLVSFL